jgi:hypothetical protein
VNSKNDDVTIKSLTEVGTAQGTENPPNTDHTHVDNGNWNEVDPTLLHTYEYFCSDYIQDPFEIEGTTMPCDGDIVEKDYLPNFERLVTTIYHDVYHNILTIDYTYGYDHLGYPEYTIVEDCPNEDDHI